MTATQILPNLSESASVWVFQANQKLNEKQILFIQESLQDFIPNWSAHGTNLNASFEVLNYLFIVVGVDEELATASGCSKDSLTQKIQAIGKAIECDFFDRMTIAYEATSNEIELIDFANFKAKIQSDTIRQDTIVYNNLISTKAALLKDWRGPLKNSWHASLMPIQ
ncbi:hypothetical protein DNU06_11365 [Putridiphycobacter roseus]|uniref:ABC transporter ATPase n=1 Tax=Putridiphycobacter roseus TaxID=2219161 RepID=A0A2W1NQD6_9FLAO|nr:hypothetical protein [Putridiphycobacter roseus]PZE16848.1 hypothetical protein DNU06_11365 [Putridiphycobacter roseus]